MGLALSDDFAGLAAGASANGRTANNALGGGFAKTWSATMLGATGGGALIAANGAYAFVQMPGGKGRMRWLFTPGSTARNAFSLWACRATEAGANPVGVFVTVFDYNNTLRIYDANGTSSTSRATGASTIVNGTPFILEIEVNGAVVTARQISTADGTTVLGSVTWTNPGTQPSGDYWGPKIDNAPASSSLILDPMVFDNLDSTSATATSPTLVHTTGANGTGSVTVNKTTGRVYGFVSTASSMLAADVIANGQSQAVVASGAQAFTFTGSLVGGVNYAYYVYDDGAGNVSTVAKSAGASVPVLVPPKIASVTVNPVDQTVVVTIVPDGTGGTITSAAASLAAVSGGAVNQGPSAAVLSGGNWVVTFTGVPFGVYGPATGTATGPDGMDSGVSSAGFSLIDPQGEPEIPDIDPPAVVAPTITTQPQSQSVQVGQSAAFSVEATNGGGVLEYQWHVDGIDVPGEIASTYETDPVTLLDNGREIGVFVSNSAGGLESALATLTVTEAPAPGPTSSYKISPSAYFALQRRRAKYA